VDVKSADPLGRHNVTFHTVLDRRPPAAGGGELRSRRSGNWKNIFSLHRASQADLSLHQREVNIDEAVLVPLSHTRPRPQSELNLAYSVQVQPASSTRLRSTGTDS
jgi:hypothetical protein